MRTKFDGFIGQAYTLRSVNVDAQRCVNLYPEIDETGQAKGNQPAYLAPTDGLTKLLTVGSGEIRLIHVDGIGRIFVVSGDEVYVITESGGTWSATLLDSNGTRGGGSAQNLSTTTGPVKAASMSIGGTGTDSSTVFVDGTKMFFFFDDAGTDYFGPLTSFGYRAVDTATDITWIDGYFVVNESGTNQFHASDIQSPNFDELTFASSEGNPDLIIGLESRSRYLYIFNEKTTEVYYNSGNADFPFERVQGGFLEVGTISMDSIAKYNDVIFWLGRSGGGFGEVYAISGLKEQRISTHAIEYAIRGYSKSSIESATGFAYQKQGHIFYVLNFDEATWVYDLTTKSWHERAYTNTSSGALERHRGQYYAFDPSHNYHLVTDYNNQKIYRFDESVYTDDGDQITRLRTCPHLSADLRRVFCHSLQVDMETGVGLSSGLGSTPYVILDFSDDGGHTWSSESWTLADNTSGSIGEYKTRVIWRRLGHFRDRIFRVKVTDPVKTILIDAWLELETEREGS